MLFYFISTAMSQSGGDPFRCHIENHWFGLAALALLLQPELDCSCLSGLSIEIYLEPT